MASSSIIWLCYSTQATSELNFHALNSLSEFPSVFGQVLVIGLFYVVQGLPNGILANGLLSEFGNQSSSLTLGTSFTFINLGTLILEHSSFTAAP